MDETRQTPIREGCPDLEVIAAYLDGRLGGPEKVEMEAHLASCDDCYSIFAESARSEAEAREGSDSTVARPRFGRWIGLAAAAVVIAAAVPAALRIRARHNARPDVAELVAAVGAERPFEPRVTGGFQFGPMKPVYRSASPAENESWELLAAAAKIRKKSEQKDTVQTLADLGVAQLLLSKYDDAVSSLEEANLRAPKDAQILTDLSAAYLVRAKEKDRADDYPKALEAAEKATELDPKLLEAWFNRAYALETLYLKGEAIKAWKDYLDRDATSSWAAEARKRRDALLAQPNHAQLWIREKPKLLAAAAAGDERAVLGIVKVYTQETREMLERELLPAWADAQLSGESEKAREILDQCRALATAHTEASGDAMMKDTVDAIDLVAISRGQLARLAEGHRLYGRAKALYEKGDTDAAESAFLQTSKLLSAANSPYGAWARFYADIGNSYHQSSPALKQRFRDHGGWADKRRYLRLDSLATWMSALIESRSGGLAAGVVEYNNSLNLLMRARETGMSAAVCSRLADLWQGLGDRDAFWRVVRQLEELSRSASNRELVETVNAAALSVAHEGFPRVALHLTGACLDGSGGDQDRAELFLTRTSIELQRGSRMAALGELRKAEDAVSEVPAAGGGQQLRAFLDEVAGKALMTSDPAGAAQHLSDAILYFEGIRSAPTLPELFLNRGLSYARSGNDALAERDFEAGFEIFEKLRRSQQAYSVPFFEQGWELLSELVRIKAIRERQPAEALDLIERGSARSLLDRKKGDVEPLSGNEILHRLPRGTTLVYFLLVDKQVLIWSLQAPGPIRFAVRNVDAGELQTLVSELRFERHSADPGALRVASTRLYSLLISPIGSALQRGQTVVFVPDGCLNDLPFSILENPKSGHILIQDHSIAVTPSGTAFVCSSRGRLPGSSAPSVLFVEGASGTTVDGELLPELRGVQVELAAIQRVARRVDVLAGANATPSRFIKDAATHDIVVFAGHSSPGGDQPGSARLFLAPEKGQSVPGVLFSKDIALSDLSRVKLVILSACSTGEGAQIRGEGPFSVARSFLDAGVPAVVSSLWPVKDARMAEVTSRLVVKLKESGDLGTALAETQLAQILSQDAGPFSDTSWASLRLYETATSINRERS